MEVQRITEMLIRMDAITKIMKERAEADRKTHREEMNAFMKSNQEQILAKTEANRQIDREERKAEQENLKRMMEEIMSRVNHETQSLQKACQETIVCHVARSQIQRRLNPIQE
jgi:hypothetical protein